MCPCVALLLNKGTHVLLLVLATILRSAGLKHDPHVRDEDTGSEMTRAWHSLRPPLGQLQTKPCAAHPVHAASCTLAAAHRLTLMRTQAQVPLCQCEKGVHTHTIPRIKVVTVKKSLVWFILNLNLGALSKSFKNSFEIQALIDLV